MFILSFWIGLLLALTLAGLKHRIQSVAGPLRCDPQNARQADAVLVLGAYVEPNGRPCVVLQDRLNTALDLYRAGKTGRFLLSGDHGRRDYDEVNAMRVFLEKRGVPKEDIFLDHAGFDTYDSMYRAKHIFGAKSLLVTTQDFHLNRALYIGSLLGLEVQGVVADRRRIPEIRSLQARELLANVKAAWEVYRKKPATLLGPTISLEGSALRTHDQPSV